MLNLREVPEPDGESRFLVDLLDEGVADGQHIETRRFSDVARGGIARRIVAVVPVGASESGVSVAAVQRNQRARSGR